MVKVRMSTADVAAEVTCLRKLIGMRCSNVYDLSPKTYLFKLMNSSGVTESGESEKLLLLMESGVRFHTTSYLRDKSNSPSGFTLKLRKHIRTRRLEDVRQLGYDRIILFQFGAGANAQYVILELYAQGNIILTDSEFTVLTLLRSHRDDDKGYAIMSRHRYPVERCRVFEQATLTKLREAFAAFQKKETGELGPSAKHGNENPGGGKRTNGKSRAKQATLKTVLAEALGCGPAFSEHIILDAGLVPSEKSRMDGILDDHSQALIRAVSRFERWLEEIISGNFVPDGFVLLQERNSIMGCSRNEHATSVQVYDEFCPMLLNQYKTREYMQFNTFDAALDEFYSKIESQKVEQQQKAKENSAFQKLAKIRLDQENRAQSLLNEAEHCVEMAKLIEYNLEDVDAAIVAVCGALARGMSWEDLACMVKEEEKLGNPVAALIHKLHLEKNSMTLLLGKNLHEMDGVQKTLPPQKVEVDLACSAHANAQRWYELKKRQQSKQEKTISAHEKALKAAERKMLLQLSQEKAVSSISQMRKVYWFEKFHWFISSENYLIIGGHDAQQNEMIVKRYMSKGDVYVHAELHGATTTVIKNRKPGQPVPPLTLNQAGCFTVCYSQAWDSKIVTSAWWVHPHQVSKTAPTGEYLTAGSFMIRGKKNFLPPHSLVMGFGLLFRIDESSLGSHLNDRRIRGEGTYDGAESGFREKKCDSLLLEDDGTGNIDVLESESAGDMIVSKDVFGSGGVANGLVVSIASIDESSRSELKVVLRNKPFVPKAERRKLKKDQKSGVVGGNVDKNEEELKENNLSLIGRSERRHQNDQAASGKICRGQRSKLKKIKKKYADQDEEERNIQIALLASAGNANKKMEPQTENAITLKDSIDAPKVCYKCKKSGHLSRDCPESAPPDGMGNKHSDGEDVPRNVSSNDDIFDGRRVAVEDDAYEAGEDNKGKLSELDYLTGNPLASDTLLHGIPICGPYSALQSYKFHVKLVPGTMKKGKAVKYAMNLFSHQQEATAVEKKLMKACTDSELLATIIGNAKIASAGLTQLKQRQRKDKKTSCAAT